MCDDFFFAVNLREKNFLHEVTIYHRKKTKGYFGIDKDNTCSNENLVWDFWVIGRIHLPLMFKSVIKETFLFFIRIRWNFVELLVQIDNYNFPNFDWIQMKTKKSTVHPSRAGEFGLVFFLLEQNKMIIILYTIILLSKGEFGLFFLS